MKQPVIIDDDFHTSWRNKFVLENQSHAPMHPKRDAPMRLKQGGKIKHNSKKCRYSKYRKCKKKSKYRTQRNKKTKK
jgi:hypothetical protein